MLAGSSARMTAKHDDVKPRAPRRKKAAADGGSRAGARAAAVPPGPLDINVRAAGWLTDLATVQSAPHRQLAYRRAAQAVLALTEPLPALVANGRITKIPFVGPSSAKILIEFLESGNSPTVTEAIAQSRQQGEADGSRSRTLRDNFLSDAVVEQILAADLIDPIVTLAEYRGDLQMHSTFSDGSQTLEQIVTACLALGHEYAAVTDHSYGLPIAHGMSMESAARQHDEIDRLNAQYAGTFRLLKGVEANILEDGRLDMTRDELRRFDLVVASPHSELRSRADQTARLLAAVSHPYVDILGHPSGRRYDRRAGLSVRWAEVFAAAARHGVAIELDGYNERQDLDWTRASEARPSGCLFAVDSDAHSSAQLRFSRIALAHARLAQLPAARIINCWPSDEILAWSAERRRRGGATRKSSR
jgi:putative hydrolase